MKISLFVPCVVAVAVLSSAQGSIMDTLPDPLQPTEDVVIESAADWRETGRPLTLELFREHIYGRTPVGRPETQSFTVKHVDPEAMEGQATLKIVDIHFEGSGGSGKVEAIFFVPNEGLKPAPGFLLICHRARSNIDPTRQTRREFWPAEEIVARGFVAAAFHVSDAAPDDPNSYQEGALRIFDPPADPRPPDAWATIAAWAWGASRVLDYMESDPHMDASRVAVLGHSRGGKAALWSGAEDERFALTISNGSGSTGAALARRMVGETVEAITRKFPHWFAENYTQYADREETLPVDQHQLIALMAPRLVYVASAIEDSWADPRGEFLACVLAAPVYQLFGLGGLGVDSMPDVNIPMHTGRFWSGGIGYHVRSGGHDLTLWDWARFMDFATIHWAWEGWVDEGDWFGLHDRRFAPWIYSAALRRWLFLPEAASGLQGDWVFLPR